MGRTLHDRPPATATNVRHLRPLHPVYADPYDWQVEDAANPTMVTLALSLVLANAAKSDVRSVREAARIVELAVDNGTVAL